MPSVDHVELGAHLVSNPAGRALRVKDLRKILAWVQSPVRWDGIAVEIQDGAEVVGQDDVDVETACDAVTMKFDARLAPID